MLEELAEIRNAKKEKLVDMLLRRHPRSHNIAKFMTSKPAVASEEPVQP